MKDAAISAIILAGAEKIMSYLQKFLLFLIHRIYLLLKSVQFCCGERALFSLKKSCLGGGQCVEDITTGDWWVRLVKTCYLCHFYKRPVNSPLVLYSFLPYLIEVILPVYSVVQFSIFSTVCFVMFWMF